MRIRVLLDECIPVQAATELPNCDVQTIRGMGWRGKKNGELLQLANGKFDVFVTLDRGLAYQQQIAKRKLGIITIVTQSNEIEALRPLLRRLRHAVLKVKPGQVLRLE